MKEPIRATGPLIAGEEGRLELRVGDRGVAGRTVRATVQPQARDAETLTVGTTDGDGLVAWTPPAAGFAALEAEDLRGSVAVAPDAARRAQALAVGATLGLVLAGGAAWALLRSRSRP